MLCKKYMAVLFFLPLVCAENSQGTVIVRSSLPAAEFFFNKGDFGKARVMFMHTIFEQSIKKSSTYDMNTIKNKIKLCEEFLEKTDQ